jgi:protease I
VHLRLAGRSVAFVVANDGVERVELAHPWRALADAGADVRLIAPKPGQVRMFNHLERADTLAVDLTTSQAQASDFDAIVLPGGVANPDILRRDQATHALLRAADAAGILIAAICHGPWTLIDAGLVAGRTLAAWPSLATDLGNAGATWTAARTHRHGNRITAQSDLDVGEFTELLLAALAPSVAHP